jgi:hypothetical protein
MMHSSAIPAVITASMIGLCFVLASSISPAAASETILISNVKITPSTLNMKSKGKFITAHMTLPAAYDDVLPQPEDITLRIILDDNETGEIIASRVSRDFFDGLVVKFPRNDVQELIAVNSDQYPGTVEFSISIETDNETLYGTDEIRVINPGKKNKGGNGKESKN